MNIIYKIKHYLSRLNDSLDLKDPVAIDLRLRAIDEFSHGFPDVLIAGERTGLFYLQYQRYGIKHCIVFKTKHELLAAQANQQRETGVEELHWVRFSAEQSTPRVPYLFSQRLEPSQYQSFDRDLSNAVLAVDWFCKTYGTEDHRLTPDSNLDARIYHAMRRRGVFDAHRDPLANVDSDPPGLDWLWQAWELSQVLFELGLPPSLEPWTFSDVRGNPYRQSTPAYVKSEDDLWRFDKTLEVLTALIKGASADRPYTIGDFNIQLIGQFRQFLPNLEARERFLDEMYHLGGHTVYAPDTIAHILNNCDIACRVTEWSVIVFDQVEIRITEPEWGKPGIYATDIVMAAIKKYNYNIETKMSGRGFRHRDLLSKLASKWGIKRDYV
jgi:hypothetical protein